MFYSYVENDGNFYNYPIHKDDISLMPDKDAIYEELKSTNQKDAIHSSKNLEDYWISSVGKLYMENLLMVTPKNVAD